MARKDRHSGDKVQAILAAARDLFAVQGFEHTPVAQIAEAAQVAGGTIIYHFKTKENLHFILSRQIIYSIFKALRHEVRQAAGPLDAVQAFVRAYQAYVEENTLDYMVLINADPFQILDASQPAYVDLRIFQGWIIMLLEDALEYGMERNELPALPVSETAQLIVSLLHAASRSHLASNGSGLDLYPEVSSFVAARLAFASQSGTCEHKFNPADIQAKKSGGHS